MKSNVLTANAYKRLFAPTKKSQMILDALDSIFHSRLAQFLGVLIVCSSVGATRGHWWIFVIPIAMFGVFWQTLAFEIFLTIHSIERQLGSFHWYSVVDDNLLLGAIPMQSQNHVEEFRKMNIRAVISVLEPWELQTATLPGNPIKPEQWHSAGIKHYVLSCRDFVPPPFEVLDEGAKILDRHLSNNERVYVHCKSGIGRSASVILSYFLRFKNEDLVSLYHQLKSKRSVIFGEKSRQMKNLILYDQKLRNPKSN